jgi:hypothetical protein
MHQLQSSLPPSQFDGGAAQCATQFETQCEILFEILFAIVLVS